jgi:membrane protein implicated in regulation of membrane protease activity
MIVVAGAAGLVVAAIALLAFGTWWALAIALAAHALGTLVVVGYAFRRAAQTEGKPDPVAEARHEEDQRELKERRRETGQINPARDYEVF